MSETIAPEIAEELYELDDDFFTEDGEWKRITKIEGDKGRWRQSMKLIIQRASDDTYWSFNYQVGLTENCDHSFPWRAGWSTAEVSPVRINRVYPHDVTTTEWRSKP